MTNTGSISLFNLLKTEDLQLKIHNLDENVLKLLNVSDNKIQVVGLSIAGFTKHMYPERIQLFGKTEMDYLEALLLEEKREKTELFLKNKPVAVVFTYPQTPPEFFKDIADKYKVPIFSTQMTSTKFIDFIKDFLNQTLAAHTTLHAQLVDVLGVGMLIMGESGVGKSETSIDLVMRGHKLIADDVVEVKYIPPTHLLGTSNEMMRNLVEIRGIGVVDLQRMFGVTSVAIEKEIDLVVRLALWDEENYFEYERIGSDVNYYEILSVKKPYYVIPVRHGSNLSSVMEIIARHFLLMKQGINVAAEFEAKLEKILLEKGGF